jgi:hypothetical protein
VSSRFSDLAPTAIGRGPESSRRHFLNERGRFGFGGSPYVVAARRGRKSASSGRDCLLGRRGCAESQERILELVRNVDRFTATESLTHQSINKHGQASAPVGRKFDYVVSIHEVRQGHLGVTEYRNGGLALNEFPGGIVTNGLPALVLIFHPYYAPSYEITCEGLTRSNDQLAWQVHFRQKPDMPNELKSYQFGITGRSYSVSLKGRAWISADSYQIVRMETDLVSPIPQIQLLAEHTTIDYGPVKFRVGDVNLWLPLSAEVYFDWRGQRVHRRHSFDHYMLFMVDDKQRINTPPAL